jgi:DNA-binding response OmpR family regulator
MEFKEHIFHILVIDDDEFLLHAVKKRLESAGYKITICDNVHDAYFKLHILKPDLILLDVIMPDINGLEFMSLIRSQYETFEIPILLMSYLDKKELLKMGYETDSFHFLSKPFNLNTLPSKLQRLFSPVK